jgi:hypothetical protein
VWRRRAGGRNAEWKVCGRSSALLHKGPDTFPGLYTRVAIKVKTNWFRGWACLDSNQGPLPYQRSESNSNASCRIQKLGLYTAISAFLAPYVSGSVRLRSSPVAARLLQKGDIPL